MGVNCYSTKDEDLPIELFEIPETLKVQEKKLTRIRKNRSTSRVKDALDAIRRCCDDKGNLMEVIVESVKASW